MQCGKQRSAMTASSVFIMLPLPTQPAWGKHGSDADRTPSARFAKGKQAYVNQAHAGAYVHTLFIETLFVCADKAHAEHTVHTVLINVSQQKRCKHHINMSEGQMMIMCQSSPSQTVGGAPMKRLEVGGRRVRPDVICFFSTLQYSSNCTSTTTDGSSALIVRVSARSSYSLSVKGFYAPSEVCPTLS